MVSLLKRSWETRQGTNWGKTPKERESDECRHQGYFCSCRPHEQPNNDLRVPRAGACGRFSAGLVGAWPQTSLKPAFHCLPAFQQSIEYRTHTPSTDEVLETKHAETGFSLRVYGWTLTHCHTDPSQLQGEVTHCPSCARCKSTWEMKGKKSNNLNNILSHRVIFL